MADIREQIKRKYGVDIETLNLFSLYKISGPDVTDQELEQAFAKKRKSWSQFLNSPREDKAAQARQHLEAADRYEAVLRDPSLRKALYAYYQKSGDGTGDTSLDFAREFFGIVGKTRRIRRQEIDFFFEYFPEQRKSRQSILEMLKTEFKVSKLDARGADGGEDERDEKKKKSALVADQFDRSTLLGIRKCQAYLTKAAAIGTTAVQFPGMSESLYRFLDLENCRDIESLRTLVKAGREKASDLRLDGGQEYTPVLDLYNKLDELLDQNDVFYNFKEFKLLVKFPNLTPYMYEIVEARERTIADLARVAQREYGFRDQYDFLFSYFLTMYSKFGIYDNGIRKMMKDAERKQGRQKFLDKVDRIRGREKTEPLPPCFTPLFFLAYLPVYLTFGVFELVKLIVWNLRYIAIPAAVPAALWLARATFGFVGYELPSWSRSSFRDTAFTFTLKPASTARLIPLSTWSSRSKPVRSANCRRSRVSRLTLMPSTPASFRRSRCCSSKMPLVVMVTASMPGIFFNDPISSGQPFRTNGSPPVIFKWRIPRRAAARQTRPISS